ncbi:bestrophin family ion channel [Mucilaginibacter gynuensis]|uniref:Bestrophin family ion channel n=1 Tax=Mucilaginibacter gynuensis TaxID=1302236 RepID=A0ABP8HJB9_9SPHI
MLLKQNIPIKYVVEKIKYELILVSVFAVSIALVHQYFPHMRISIPIAVPAILATIISLLLAFRSNQAYDRWWEARGIWGSIVNDSRSLTRQLTTFLDNNGFSEEVESFKKRFVRRQIAWCYSLSDSLRNQNAYGRSTEFLLDEEIEYTKRFSNMPNSLLKLHGMDIRLAYTNGWINEYQQVELDRTLTRLCDSMGKCERIKNTVFPVTYSLYIHFSLYLFIALMPFGLIEYFGMFEVPLIVAIAAAFMLVEKMAIHLQDPFENKPTDTPTTAISQTIERDLKQMLNDNHSEDKHAPVHSGNAQANVFYIL